MNTEERKTNRKKINNKEKLKVYLCILNPTAHKRKGEKKNTKKLLNFELKYAFKMLVFKISVF